eukprot:UN02601
MLKKFGGKHLRVLFNSIGALGSVNHLHFQPYFTREKETIESMKPVSTGIKYVSLFVSDWPFTGICVDYVEKDETFEETAKLVMKIVSVCQKLDQAHNMFFTPDRIFIYPRINELEGFDQTKVGVAAMEFSGHFILKTEDHLKIVT